LKKRSKKLGSVCETCADLIESSVFNPLGEG